MKNRSQTLLMTVSLGLAGVPGALAQSTTPASATSSAQSADPRLAAANVSLEIGTYSGPLSSLLAAVGFSIQTCTPASSASSARSVACTRPSS